MSNENDNKQTGMASGLDLFSDGKQKRPAIVTRALQNVEKQPAEIKKVQLSPSKTQLVQSGASKPDEDKKIVFKDIEITESGSKTELSDGKNTPDAPSTIIPTPTEQPPMEQITLERYIAQRMRDFVMHDSHEAARKITRSVRLSEAEEKFWMLYEHYRKILPDMPSMSDLIRGMIKEQMRKHLPKLIELEYKQMMAKAHLEHEKFLFKPQEHESKPEFTILTRHNASLSLPHEPEPANAESQ